VSSFALVPAGSAAVSDSRAGGLALQGTGAAALSAAGATPVSLSGAGPSGIGDSRQAAVAVAGTGSPNGATTLALAGGGLGGAGETGQAQLALAGAGNSGLGDAGAAAVAIAGAGDASLAETGGSTLSLVGAGPPIVMAGETSFAIDGSVVLVQVAVPENVVTAGSIPSRASKPLAPFVPEEELPPEPINARGGTTITLLGSGEWYVEDDAELQDDDDAALSLIFALAA
jgi:hypothetical protein